MNRIKIIAVLTFVSLFSAGALSLADILSRERVRANQEDFFNRAVITVLPGTAERRRVDGVEELYEAIGEDGKVLGYLFSARGQGYADEIIILAAADRKLDNLLGIEIISSRETPGLGARINDSWFKGQFRRLNVSPEILYSKTEETGDNYIQTITGATVSSRAVVNILNRKIGEIKAFFADNR